VRKRIPKWSSNISRVERAVTYVGLEIIGKLASVLEVDPAEFGSRRKAD
jgi:hypothetical protein